MLNVLGSLGLGRDNSRHTARVVERALGHLKSLTPEKDIDSSYGGIFDSWLGNDFISIAKRSNKYQFVQSCFPSLTSNGQKQIPRDPLDHLTHGLV